MVGAEPGFHAIAKAAVNELLVHHAEDGMPLAPGLSTWLNQVGIFWSRTAVLTHSERLPT